MKPRTEPGILRSGYLTKRELLTLVPSVLVVIIVGYFLFSTWSSSNEDPHALNKTKIDYILSNGDISLLPPSTTNIFYHQWNGLFTGAAYARWQMSASDLQFFLSNSPALQDPPTEVYDKERHCLSISNADEARGLHHYHSFSGAPEWFAPTVMGKGRMYFEWPNKWLYFDEERNIVWMYFSKG